MNTADTHEAAQTAVINYEAEQALLGAILANNRAYEKVSEFLAPEHFADAVHGRVFAAMGRLIERGQVVDVLTLKPLFAEDPALEAVGGGGPYLVRLAASVVTVINAEDYGRTVYDCWLRRQLTEHGRRLIDEAADWRRPADEVAARLVDELSRIVSLDTSARTKRQVAEGLVERIKTPVKPFPTGLRELDTAMGGGLFPGRQYAMAGRKKIGKTILLGSISHNLNAARVPHLFIACEMGPAEIEARSAAWELGINSIRFLRNEVNAAQVAEYAVGVPDFTVYEALPGGSFADVRRAVARAMVRFRIRGVILDYWQLVGGKAPNETEEYHMRQVAQWLADTCRRHGLFALVAAQVNQEGNTRGGEGLKLASDMYFTMHREKRAQGAWLEMEETRYTMYGDVGSATSPGLWLDNRGPCFVDASDRRTPPARLPYADEL